jgi:hypothetical protein
VYMIAKSVDGVEGNMMVGVCVELSLDCYTAVIRQFFGY